MKYHIDRNADRLDFDPTDEPGEMKEYLRKVLLPVSGHWNFEDFKEWIEENGWCVFESSNRSWINGRRVISTETLYQLYATSTGREKILEELKIQSIL